MAVVGILEDMDRDALATTIRDNLEQLHAQIAHAAQRAGRQAHEIKLIAVSKNQPAPAIDAAVAAGQRAFGENTAQEALIKIPQFADQGLEWHFIGHLQANKAKLIPGNFTCVHSLDSVKLAQRLARFANEKNIALDCLLEVNITRDPAKHGVLAEQVAPLLDQLLKENLANLKLRGLMTIGPHPASETERRTAFAALRQLRDHCRQQYPLPYFTELSMGMSGDFAEAIAEGSTLVRVGTAIFGQRDYQPRTLK